MEAEDPDSPVKVRDTTFDESYIGFKAIGVSFVIILICFCSFLAVYCFKKCIKENKKKVAPKEEQALPTERTLLPSDRPAPSSRSADSNPVIGKLSSELKLEVELKRIELQDKKLKAAKYSRANSRLLFIKQSTKKQKLLRKIKTQNKVKTSEPILSHEGKRVSRVQTYQERKKNNILSSRSEAGSFVITDQLRNLPPRRKNGLSSSSMAGKSDLSKLSPRQGAAFSRGSSIISNLKYSTPQRQKESSVSLESEKGEKKLKPILSGFRHKPTIIISCDSDPSPEKKKGHIDSDHLSIGQAQNTHNYHHFLTRKHVQFDLPDENGGSEPCSPERETYLEQGWQASSLKQQSGQGSLVLPRSKTRRKAIKISKL